LEEWQENTLIGAGIIVGGLITYLGIVQLWDYVIVKNNLALEARKHADYLGKPLLNVGCGNTAYGDVNLDINPKNVPHFIQGDATDIPYPDKYFGALFASHILEHLEDPDQALREWNRVADKVFVLVPPIYNPFCLDGDHKWIFIGDNKIRIPGR